MAKLCERVLTCAQGDSQFECLLLFILLQLMPILLRLRFGTNVLNMIDLLAISPFYVELIVELVRFLLLSSCLCFIQLKYLFATLHLNTYLLHPQRFQGSPNSNVPNWLRIFRLVRVVRLLKLSKYSEGLQLMGKTLYQSAAALGMLLFAEGILQESSSENTAQHSLYSATAID